MTTRFVSPAGGTGAGTIGDPWSLTYAAGGAGGAIVAGDVVLLRGGAYDGTFTFSVSGAVGNPITFQNYPGEFPIIDSSFAAMRAIGNSEWELYDAPTGTYRTVTAGYAAGGNFGHIKIGTAFWPLATHKTLADLMATREDYDDTVEYYVGPGITQDVVSGRIYCRLQNSAAATMFNRDVPQVANGDPRQNEIHIGTTATTCVFSGSHLRFVGLEVNEGYTLWGTITSPTDVQWTSCTGRPGFHIARLASSSHLKWDTCTFRGLMDPARWWVDYSSIKGGRTVSDANRKCAFDIGSVTYMEIVGCTIEWFFDGLLGPGPATDIEVHNSTFRCWDDMWQMYGNLERIEVHNNDILGAGTSCDQTGSTTDVADPGKIFIDHNVIDTKLQLIWWGRKGAGFDSTNGYDEAIAFSTHGQITTGFAFARKIYHNTVITGLPHNPYLDVGFYGVATAAQFHAGIKHQVMNNIFVMDTYIPATLDANVTTGREIWDGNIYYAAAAGGYPTPTRPHRRVAGSAGVFLSGTRGPTLAELQSGTLLTDAQAYYAPGWEASGLVANPSLDSNYLPANAAVLTGAVDLTATGWPRTGTYETFRGAIGSAPVTPPSIDPTATTMRSLRRRALVGA